jgi:hypothetical protein
LPVRIRHFSGYFSKQVHLNLETGNDAGTPDQLDVEKSSDGIHFKSWKTLSVMEATSSIQLSDDAFFSPISFYRLKTMQNTSPVYSQIVAVRTSDLLNATILNNPMNGETLALKIQSPYPQMIQVRIFTHDGRSVFQKNISVGSGTSTLPIQLPAHLFGHCILEYRSLKSQQAKRLSFFKTR